MSDPSQEVGTAPAYRTLILSSDGIVIEVQSVDAVDDEEAFQVAQAMVDGHAVELWDGLRFIEHFPPRD